MNKSTDRICTEKSSFPPWRSFLEDANYIEKGVKSGLDSSCIVNHNVNTS